MLARASPRHANPVAGARIVSHNDNKPRKKPDECDSYATRLCPGRILLPQQRACQGRDSTHRQPQQEADVDADVDPIPPGAAGRRLRLRCTALHP